MKTIVALIVSLLIVNSTMRAEKQADKHPLDKSESRKLILDNGLKVYLLSDPDFNVSAASLSVEVGSLEDPHNREGRGQCRRQR